VLFACRGWVGVMYRGGGGASHRGGRFLGRCRALPCSPRWRARWVPSDRSSEGHCAGSPLPLGMLPAANHIYVSRAACGCVRRAAARGNGGDIVCVQARDVCVCVCSDQSSEGLCTGSPWPLGMIPAAWHI
jgi:hypothetical protein